MLRNIGNSGLSLKHLLQAARMRPPATKAQAEHRKQGAHRAHNKMSYGSTNRDYPRLRRDATRRDDALRRDATQAAPGRPGCVRRGQPLGW